MKKTFIGSLITIAGVMLSVFNMPETEPEQDAHDKIDLIRTMYCYCIPLGIIIAVAGIGNILQARKKRKFSTRFRFIYVLPFLILGLVPKLNAQGCSGIIYGAVRDSKGKSLMEAVSIKINPAGETVVTDADGHYHFEGLCSGAYTLTFSFVGYQSREVKVVLNKQKEQNVSLNPQTTELGDVQVTGRKIELKPLQISAHLDEKTLEMSRGESLGETLKALPGINSIQTGPTISKPVIQGLSGNRVLIYNAGVRQEGQQWGSEHAPEVDPFIASEITVVKGASSVMYGSDAIGGVVLVEPAVLTHSGGLQGKMNMVGMTNSGLGAVSGQLEGSFGPDYHFSWRIVGTARIAGNSKTADYYLKNTGLREFNGAAILGYKNKAWAADFYASTFNTRLGIFSGSNVGSTEDRNAAIDRGEPLDIYKSDLNYKIERPYQLVNHHIAKLRVGYKFENAGSLNFQYSYQQNYREEYDVVRASSRDKYQYQFDLSTQVADLYFDHSALPGLNGRIGVNAIFQRNYYDGAYLIPFFKSAGTAAYLIERWTKNHLGLEAGLRYDYKHMDVTKRINPRDNNSPVENPIFDFSQVSGTLGASYMLPEDFRLTATAAIGWRPPSINELFIEGVHQGNAAFERGDRNLQEESSFNLSAGISRQTGKLTGELNVYRNRIANYIYLQPQIDAYGNPVFEITQRGGFLSYRYTQIDARFTGIDAMLSYELSKQFTLGGKYALVRAYDTRSGDHLIYIPADKVTGSLRYQLPEMKQFKSTDITLAASRVARQSRVRDNQDFSAAPGGYTLLDASVSTVIPVGGNKWDFSLSINNLINTEYRDYLNRFRYYSADLGRNITLRLQIPFGKNNN